MVGMGYNCIGGKYNVDVEICCLFVKVFIVVGKIVFGKVINLIKGVVCYCEIGCSGIVVLYIGLLGDVGYLIELFLEIWWVICNYLDIFCNDCFFICCFFYCSNLVVLWFIVGICKD